MITKLTVKNFKCLRDVSVDFAPLTVLIGPNDSGKTSILEALYLLGQLAAKPTTEVFSKALAPENLIWKRDPKATLKWELRGSYAKYECKFAFELAKDNKIVSDTFQAREGVVVARDSASGQVRRGPNDVLPGNAGPNSSLNWVLRGGGSPFPEAAKALVSHERLRLDPDDLRKRTVTKPGLVLSASGDNLAGVLDALMTGPDREAVTAMEAALHMAIPTLRGVSTPSPSNGQPGEKAIEFVLADPAKPPVTIPCELASDGAMLMTAFLTLAYSDTPDVLLIEEPENGLHPTMLASVVQLLRQISIGEVGLRPRQVILTTHSPLLLNYAEPEEIRIVRRDAKKGTNVTPMTKVDGIAELLKEFGVGELWNLLGEQGLVEGKKP